MKADGAGQLHWDVKIPQLDVNWIPKLAEELRKLSCVPCLVVSPYAKGRIHLQNATVTHQSDQILREAVWFARHSSETQDCG